jgi:hypothetical protein
LAIEYQNQTQTLQYPKVYSGLAVLRQLLESFADAMDGWMALSICLIVLCVVPLGIIEAHSHLLTNDEIYTLHIARSPTIGRLLALTREIDLHPPVHYLAVREALRTGLPRRVAARLPSLLAAVLLSLCLFQWTSRRLGNLFAFSAVGVFWLSPALDMAWSDRPYMLWLAWLCVLLLARDVAMRDDRPWWAVPAVFAATLLMVLTHLLGIACVGPFLLAEAWRALQRRRVDWMYVLALVTPTLCGLAFYYQIHHLSENSFPLQQLPSFGAFVITYTTVVVNTMVVILGCLMGALVLFGRDARETERRLFGAYSVEDFILLVSLVALPVVILLAGHVFQIQFWLRYGYAAAPAWALLAAWILARKLPLPRMVAVIMAISCVGYMVGRMLTEATPQGNAGIMEGGRMPIPLASLNPNLPIVTASPMTFVEMSDREKPDIAKRVVYLTDVHAAMQYSHYTLFENEGKIARLLNLPSHGEPLQPFLQQHQEFYVVGDYHRPEVWLLRKLAADGLDLDYLGTFQSTYQSEDLYLVRQ